MCVSVRVDVDCEWMRVCVSVYGCECVYVRGMCVSVDVDCGWMRGVYVDVDCSCVCV